MTTMAHAIERRFEDVRRDEMKRLRRKTAALTATQRADIDEITALVFQGIAARMADALAADGDEQLVAVLAHLFQIPIEEPRPAGARARPAPDAQPALQPSYAAMVA
jgi:hypothetical protein